MKARGLLSLVTFSEKRSEILLMLLEGPKSLDDIKNYFRATTPEILPRLKELESSGLIYQEERKYYLSEVGEVIAKSFSRFYRNLKIFEKDMKFWEEHQISGIPEKFRLRLYELGDYEIFRSTPTEIFKPHDEYVKNLLRSKWIRGVSPVLHPDYPKFILKLAEEGKDITIIITKDVLKKIEEKHKIELEEGLQYKNAKLMLCNEEVKVAFTTSNMFLSMRLFLKSGIYDFYQNLISHEKSAIKWGKELFDYFKKRSEEIKSLNV